MTNFEISRFRFAPDEVKAWAGADKAHSNWPVVYLLDNADGRTSDVEIYVGETLNAQARLRQHLVGGTKAQMRQVRVILDERFNKSAALDLESSLIRWFAGDGRFTVMNRNDGVVDTDYFERVDYRRRFEDVFGALRDEGLFTRGIEEIENDDLFKLSPFKALTLEQSAVVEQIMQVVSDRLLTEEDCTIVVRGAPGTGKTIVGVFLLKLIADLGIADPTPESDTESPLSDLFTDESAQTFSGLDVGFVIPQQSLRKSVQRVFRATRGLSAKQVTSPFTLAERAGRMDVVVVDETHRLNQRANQPSGPQNKKFAQITRALFGSDDVSKTQLDWVIEKSQIRILLLDERQAVMPADLPGPTVQDLIATARGNKTYFELQTQMRMRAGSEYVDHVRSLFDVEKPPSPLEQAARIRSGDYEIRFFGDVELMHEAIRERDQTFGLSRLVAGYAWPWRSKNDPTAVDIEIDGYGLRWNQKVVDWIASPGSLEEVGSIHTVQGYDLNYAGVIIGPDLRLDPNTGRIVGVRDSYFDKRGKQNNKVLDQTYSDYDITRFIADIYGVLLTRGIRGTFLHVVDPELRQFLQARL